QYFTTGSWALFNNDNLRMIGLNIAAYDALKHDSHPLVTDAREGLKALSAGLSGWKAPAKACAIRREGRLKHKALSYSRRRACASPR
ncbi:3D-(3,5/4)-trihydroxycyclohexane-1,2-dione acylhydrolase (decyclizing), partial [Rhizobium ruizarguesonis]